MGLGRIQPSPALILGIGSHKSITKEMPFVYVSNRPSHSVTMTRMKIETVAIGKVLTRTGGYLRGVATHSLQPYGGCPLGSSLCGVGCYVRHNPWITRGRAWGSFLEVRDNAAESYRKHIVAERRWARRRHGAMGIFMASSTEPFPPQEKRHRVSARILEAMLDEPPDVLTIQTHSHRVEGVAELLKELSARCRVRVHLSIETDRERLPGLPPPGSSVERRLQAAERLQATGILTVITVAPLLPIADPESFFVRIAQVADAVVLDHFIGGDGSPDGARTRRTPLPQAMAELLPESLDLDYRDAMVEIARRHLPGRVGVGAEGFAGKFG